MEYVTAVQLVITLFVAYRALEVNFVKLRVETHFVVVKRGKAGMYAILNDLGESVAGKFLYII